MLIKQISLYSILGLSLLPTAHSAAVMVDMPWEDAPRTPTARGVLEPITPTTHERNVMNPFLKEMLKIDTSPEARRAISRLVDSKEVKTVTFDGKTVHRFKMDLFEAESLVLNEKTGRWETNLKRMMDRGCAPIATKGITSPAKRQSLTNAKKHENGLRRAFRRAKNYGRNTKRLLLKLKIAERTTATLREEILTQQRNYVLTLHHLTQKDTDTPEDPIMEITQMMHSGMCSRMICRDSEETGQIEILYTDLTKREARSILTFDGMEGCYEVYDLLHFRDESSFVDRKAFAQFRRSYWMDRAAEIIYERENRPPDINSVDMFPALTTMKLNFEAGA